jgi:hypothetical protein
MRLRRLSLCALLAPFTMPVSAMAEEAKASKAPEIVMEHTIVWEKNRYEHSSRSFNNSSTRGMIKTGTTIAVPRIPHLDLIAL